MMIGVGAMLRFDECHLMVDQSIVLIQIQRQHRRQHKRRATQRAHGIQSRIYWVLYLIR